MAGFRRSDASHRRLRIALFSDSALPILNGVSISVDSLLRQLRERGHSVHLWTSRFPGRVEEDPNVVRLASSHTPWTPGYPLAIPPFWRRRAEFRRMEFDVIHTHTPFTVGTLGLRWGEAFGIPVVGTYHTHYERYSHYVPYIPQPLVEAFIRRHTGRYYRRVSAAVAPSPYAAEILAGHDIGKPVEVIPTGIPLPAPHDRAAERRALGLAPHHLALVTVGRLAPEKNQARLLEAVARLQWSHPELRLLVVGAGKARPELTRLCRELGIGDRVRFLGSLPREQVDRVYAAGDLFVFTSQTETQGLVVVEAMASGLPVVVIRGGGAGLAVEPGENGLMVEDSTEELADAIHRLAGDPELRAKMSERARASAEDWSLESMTDRILALYHRVLPAEPQHDHLRTPRFEAR